MLLLLPRQVGGKLNNLGTGQCTVPETPIALRVRRVGVVTTENGTSVSPRVVNRTQAHRFRVVIARKWPRARSSSLIFDHPLRSFRAICCPATLSTYRAAPLDLGPIWRPRTYLDSANLRSNGYVAGAKVERNALVVQLRQTARNDFLI